MRALRFWLEMAKRVLGIWDDTTKEMDYNPFKAKEKSQTKKVNDVGNN